MELDDTVCFCFHVSYRKLRNYAKHNKPKVASQMSECLGAGTGCGWCRKIIVKIWDQYGQQDDAKASAAPLPTLEERKAEREKYWLEKYGRAPKEGERGK